MAGMKLRMTNESTKKVVDGRDKPGHDEYESPRKVCRKKERRGCPAQGRA
jgi:hypothetical protein